MWAAARYGGKGEDVGWALFFAEGLVEAGDLGVADEADGDLGAV